MAARAETVESSTPSSERTGRRRSFEALKALEVLKALDSAPFAVQCSSYIESSGQRRHGHAFMRWGSANRRVAPGAEPATAPMAESRVVASIDGVPLPCYRQRTASSVA